MTISLGRSRSHGAKIDSYRNELTELEFGQMSTRNHQSLWPEGFVIGQMLRTNLPGAATLLHLTRGGLSNYTKPGTLCPLS